MEKVLQINQKLYSKNSIADHLFLSNKRTLLHSSRFGNTNYVFKFVVYKTA